jgi:hypothetical protein
MPWESALENLILRGYTTDVTQLSCDKDLNQQENKEAKRNYGLHMNIVNRMQSACSTLWHHGNSVLQTDQSSI